MAMGQDPMATMIVNALTDVVPPAVTEPAPTIPAPVEQPPAPIPALETAPTPAAPPAEAPIEVAEPETPEQLFAGGILDPNSTRGQKIWSAYSLVKELVKPESEGGIGHEPSVEDIKTYHSNHSTLSTMLNDFETQPDMFLRGMVQVNPEAAAGMITELPNILDQLAATHPAMAQAQEALYTNVNEATVNGLVDLAKGTTGEMQKFYFNLARNLKYFISGGKVELKDTLLSEPIDPLAQERQQLQRERENLNRAAAERDQRMLNGFRNEMFQGLNGKLEDSFAWPKEFEAEFWFPTMKADRLAQVRRAVGESSFARNELDSIMALIQRQVKAGQNAQAAAAQFQNTFLKYARPHIARIRAEVIQKAGRQATKPAPAAQPPAPAAASVPGSSPSMSAMPRKDAGESFENYATKFLNGVLGVQ